jgi:rubrerythrin
LKTSCNSPILIIASLNGNKNLKRIKMNQKIFDILIEYELLISEIYMKFAHLNQEDADLWWKLAIEEKGHASILKSGKDAFAPLNMFPEEFLKLSLEKMEEELHKMQHLLDKIKSHPEKFSQIIALKTAIALENKTIEKLFEDLMNRNPEDQALKIFQKLNSETRAHAQRLQDYLNEIE